MRFSSTALSCTALRRTSLRSKRGSASRSHTEMFTGIVEEVGTVESIEKNAGGGARLRIACREVVSDATQGSSIAVNGVCLTALDVTRTGFHADLAPETLQRTNLGELTPSALVNLERPLLATGRLS